MFCTSCGRAQSDSAKFCSECGAPRITKTPESKQTSTAPQESLPYEAETSIQAPQTKKMGPLAIIGIVVGALLVVGFAIGSQHGSSNTTTVAEETQTETPTPDPVPVNWAPDGYTQYDDQLAYKFTTKQGKWPCNDCNFWKVTVIANEGCPGGVYGELNMMDSSGTVQDWTNDSISYLGPGKKAVLKFTHYGYDSSLKTGELTTLTCNG